MNFIDILPTQINENFFMKFEQSALLCAGDIENCNMMTIGWGEIGTLWYKPVVVIYVRPQRYTLEFIEKTKTFTVNFLDIEKYKNELIFCGTKSGQDCNKFSKTQLTPYKTKDSVGILESELILSCTAIYSDYIKEDNFIAQSIVEKYYPNGDYHKFFIAEITSTLKKY